MAVTGLDKVLGNWISTAEKIESTAESATALVIALLVRYLKAEHPWQNQTGATEASIDGEIVEATPLLITAVVYAQTPYAPFLELARDGKWSWMWDTIMRHLEEFRAIYAASLVTGVEALVNPDIREEYESYKESMRGYRRSESDQNMRSRAFGVRF